MAEASLLEGQLKVAHLSISYGKTAVLNDITFSVPNGEVVAILGKSGCGKSSLLRAIAGLEPNANGRLSINGEIYSNGAVWSDISTVKPPDITLVFQDYALFPNLSVLRNITLPLERSRKLRCENANDKAKRLLLRFGLEHFANRYPGELSGGEQQRVALIRGLALEPKVLLLDEITSALDPENVIGVVETLREVKIMSPANMIIIFVTHLTEFAKQFADRMLFLGNGAILDDFSPTEYDNPCRKPETRSFLRKLMIAR